MEMIYYHYYAPLIIIKRSGFTWPKLQLSGILELGLTFGRAWGTFFPKLPIERNQGKYFKSLRISFECLNLGFCGFPMDRLSFLANFFPTFFILVRDGGGGGGRKTINAP